MGSHPLDDEVAAATARLALSRRQLQAEARRVSGAAGGSGIASLG
jgi:hypothetical protein